MSPASEKCDSRQLNRFGLYKYGLGPGVTCVCVKRCCVIFVRVTTREIVCELVPYSWYMTDIMRKLLYPRAPSRIFWRGCHCLSLECYQVQMVCAEAVRFHYEQAFELFISEYDGEQFLIGDGPSCGGV